MPLVFKSDPDSTQDVVIAGVGTLPAGGVGGIPVEKAAPAMTELQAREEDGSVKLGKDGNPVVLRGDDLEAAAKDWAKTSGAKVVSLSDGKVENLLTESGLAPEPMPVAQAGAELAAYLYPEEPDPDLPLEPVSDVTPAGQGAQTEGTTAPTVTTGDDKKKGN